mmetsp:Transcript_31785/g.79879  ORF Transcript_31785/g.79879 Transcript_31785/m.79879 type:complete len:246 (+) Transcript_31785:2284-3021(+)
MRVPSSETPLEVRNHACSVNPASVMLNASPPKKSIAVVAVSLSASPPGPATGLDTVTNAASEVRGAAAEDSTPPGMASNVSSKRRPSPPATPPVGGGRPAPEPRESRTRAASAGVEAAANASARACSSRPLHAVPHTRTPSTSPSMAPSWSASPPAPMLAYVCTMPTAASRRRSAMVPFPGPNTPASKVPSTTAVPTAWSTTWLTAWLRSKIPSMNTAFTCPSKVAAMWYQREGGMAARGSASCG